MSGQSTDDDPSADDRAVVVRQQEDEAITGAVLRAVDEAIERPIHPPNHGNGSTDEPVRAPTPLYETIASDALNRLFEEPQPALTVSFRYLGVQVTVAAHIVVATVERK